ncbi:olfactory receptor 6M1-like [Heteronotia binoei]|uniref:olfactory receptor 6M1-like n=1 Tax=Heteronotia binoei TaxID=13085 RepID=UPI00292FEB4B|nr:olfactory receptor 6M1-like [Heteronotia binoei]
MTVNDRENVSGTTVTEFVLLGFSNHQEMEVPLFVLFLTMYVLTILGNALVILLIHLDARLHTPMYYFLSNLSWLEIIITTTVTPKMLSLLISKTKTISYLGCVVQTMSYFLAGATEVLLLGAMSVDRYLAICNPLRYTAIMSNQVCMLMMLSCWMGSIASVMVTFIFKSGLPFCGPNVIDHFFCDANPLTQLLCADTTMVQAVELISSCFTLLTSVFVTSVSYFCIIVTVMRMPSVDGRKKAFSTCSSHITVASLYYGSSIFIYVRPAGSTSMDFNKVATVFNTVVTPLLNPIIYNFRNKVVKDVMRDKVKHISGRLEKTV